MYMEGKAALIKSEIKKQYKSLRQFSIAVNMPYSTIAIALEKGDKGIEAMAYNSVIAICNKLNIDPINFLPVSQSMDSLMPQERRLLLYYSQLNMQGKNKIIEQMEDMGELEKYRNDNR